MRRETQGAADSSEDDDCSKHLVSCHADMVRTGHPLSHVSPCTNKQGIVSCVNV